MNQNQTLPKVIKYLPQPFEFDSKRKSVEFKFSSDKLGSFIITEYVTRKRVHGTFKIAKVRKFNVLLANNIKRLQRIFIVKKPFKGLEEA